MSCMVAGSQCCLVELSAASSSDPKVLFSTWLQMAPIDSNYFIFVKYDSDKLKLQFDQVQHKVRWIIMVSLALFEVMFYVCCDYCQFNYFITKMEEAFNLQQFRDVFMVTQKIKNKLQPFIVQYKAQNMNWIINSFEELHRLFFDDKIDIILKFNSIFGLKFMFDTGDAVLVSYIQIYFLPRILQIATYQPKEPADKRGVTFFLKNGYTKETAEIQKYGYNFVRMATQFIFNAAIVKPRRVFEGDQLNQPSEFQLAHQALTKTGWKPYATPAYYKEGTAQAIRKVFQRSSAEINIDNYLSYYQVVFKGILEESKPYQGRLNPYKLIEFGDSDVSAIILTLCDDAYRSKNLRLRKNVLSMLNVMIKWGDIEAANEVNCTNMLDQILKEVAKKNDGSRVLARGKKIYKQNKSSEQDKQQLYVQLLKDIQFWALCYPKGLKNKSIPSKIKTVHDELRGTLQIQFPEDKELKQNKAIFDEQSKKHKQRNEILLQQLTEKDPQNFTVLDKNQDSNNPYLPETSTPAPPTRIGYDHIKRDIAEAKVCIDTLCESQGKVDAKIEKLRTFPSRYESALEQGDLSNEQFDELLGEGEQVIQRINKINDPIQKYKSKRITFAQFTDIIHPKSPSKQSQSKIKQQSPVQKSKKDIKVEEQPKPMPKIQQGVIQRGSKKDIKVIQQSSNLPAISQSKFRQRQVQSSPTLNIKPGFLQGMKQVPAHSIKKLEPQFTPIKKYESPEKKQQFGSERSSLPQVSKQSIQKQREQSSIKQQTQRQQREAQSLNENINIQPASHVIIQKQVSIQAGDKHRSMNRMENSLKQNSNKVIPPSPIKEANSKSIPYENKEKSNQELRAQIQSNFQIKKPKAFDKLVSGSYAGKKNEQNLPYENQRVRTPASRSNLKQSRQQQNMRFEESKISQINVREQDEDDLIMMPDNNPLQVSFHDLGRVQDILKQPNTLSFKKCFEDDKYLFGQDRNNKKFLLANQTISLIRPASQSRKHSRTKDSSISIPDILNERNKKFQEELKYVQQKKNRKITELESRIKNLQQNGQVMKERLVEKDRQIRSIKANSQAQSSRVKKTSILQDQGVIFKAKLATVHNKSIKDRSFYDDSKKQPRYLDPHGRLVNSRKYVPFFQQFQSEKHKKNLLKNKQLLLKNDEIEFGCMTKRDKETLLITYYITPAQDLDGLICRVNHVDNLSIQLQPKNIPSIRKGKQQKIIVSVNIVDIPFMLPSIQFSYNLGMKLDTQQFLIPCTLHKFIYFSPVDQKEISRKFERSERVLRGEEVPYSKKLLKNLQSLSDYFAHGSLLNHGNNNDNGEIQFAGRSVWKSQEFWMRIMIKQSQYLYVQTVSDSVSNLQEYYISLVTNLLMKNLDLKEM